MDTVTYPDDKVVEFINEHLVPLRLDHDNLPFSRDYSLIWTPTLIVLDTNGREFHRSIGFMEPDELIPFLMLGYSKVNINLNHYDGAKLQLENIVAHFPQSASAPAALYFLGVNQFKAKNDPKELRKAYEGLQEKYPGTSWAKKAAPYQHL